MLQRHQAQEPEQPFPAEETGLEETGGEREELQREPEEGEEDGEQRDVLGFGRRQAALPQPHQRAVGGGADAVWWFGVYIFSISEGARVGTKHACNANVPERAAPQQPADAGAADRLLLLLVEQQRRPRARHGIVARLPPAPQRDAQGTEPHEAEAPGQPRPGQGAAQPLLPQQPHRSSLVGWLGVRVGSGNTFTAAAVLLLVGCACWCCLACLLAGWLESHRGYVSLVQCSGVCCCCRRVGRVVRSTCVSLWFEWVVDI